MKRLYKYYSSSFDIGSYLKDPTIRLSQLHSLNDPFEGMLTDDLMDKVIPIIQKELYPEEPLSNTYRRYTKISIRRTINEFGIGSVSETHRNLLMWAHYASEHKGICIGYNPLMLEYKNKTFESDLQGKKVLELKKVNYDTVPFDAEHIDEIANDNIFSEEAFEFLTERAVTTKSDAWLYEKEHRYISNINLCDQIVILRKKKDLAGYMIAAIEKAISDNTYDVIYEDRKVTLKSKRSNNEIVKNIANDSCPVISALLPSKEVLFLVNVDKSDITSIHLGSRFEYKKREEIISAIESDPKLRHINVYEYEESTNRYELEEKRIHPA